MKKIISILLLLVLSACKSEFNKSNLTNSLTGNWSSAKNSTYLEFTFLDKKMYMFNIESGDLMEWNYFVKNDSIFNSFKFPNEKEHSEYRFFSKILEIDSSGVHLESRILIPITDSISLGSLILNEVDKKAYINSYLQREKNIMPERDEGVLFKTD